jgi:putative ABC transport system substrate-binding protein
MDRCTRREFIALFGGAAVTPPHPAHSREPERMRRIGVLVGSFADDPLSQIVVGAFSQGLQEYGWIIGRNLLIEYRWAATDDDRLRQYATELVAFAPNVILAFGGTAARSLRCEVSDVPVVFVNTSDPVASGLVGNLARPQGNMTGFLSIEYGRSVKWLELLKQTAPRVTRAAVIRDPASVGGTEQFDVIQVQRRHLGWRSAPTRYLKICAPIE